jgi:hypothetical protein
MVCNPGRRIFLVHLGKIKHNTIAKNRLTKHQTSAHASATLLQQGEKA